MSTAQIYNKAQSDTLLADKVSKTAAGTQSIASGLAVGGVLTQGTYSVDSDITVNFTSSAGGSLQCYYAHGRVSNGKLSIVIAFYMPYKSDSTATIPAFANLLSNVTLAVDSDTYSKLHANPLGSLDAKSVVGIKSGFALGPALSLNCFKQTTNTLGFSMQAPVAIPQPTTQYNDMIWRFEFNFILS